MSEHEHTGKGRVADGLRVAFGVGGLIAIVIGLLIVIYPAASGGAVLGFVAAVVAAYTLVVGVVYLGSALFSKNLRGWARTGNILLGLLYLVAGIVVMVNLGAAAAFLAVFLSVLVGIVWLAEGVIALTTLKQHANRAWTVVYAVISLLAGAALLLSPLLGAVTLWMLLGISLLVLGVVQVARAASLGRR